MLHTPAKPAAKRDAILAAAADLFLEEGYGAASINRLIERVGGSKSTVYAYFPSKEALFEAVVEAVVGEIPELITREQLGSCGLRDGLRAIGERLLQLATSRRHLELARVVIAEADRFPEIGRVYYKCGPGHIRCVLEDFVRAREGEEGYAVDALDEAVDAFTGMLLHGPVFRRFCVEPDPPQAGEIRRMAAYSADMFIAALPSSEARAATGAAS